MKLLFICVLMYCFRYSFALLGENNVCTTFDGYYTNTDCYYNPDQVLEAPEIITRYGYSLESYNVTTADGYILTVFRIPSTNGNSTPVFLQHGIFLSAIGFVDIGGKSLAFQLSDNGYDVWLGNFRGNRYSRNHTFLSNEDKKFWDFSFHELGIYDVSAQIDLVTQTTNKSIIYVGYSMGTTAGFIYSLTYPEIARQNIKTMISLAPVAYLKDIPSVLRYLESFWLVLEPFFEITSHGELFNRDSLMSTVMREFCLFNSGQMLICNSIIQSVFGFDFPQINPETLPITLAQNGDSISTKTVTHFRQIMKSDRFQNYDYGLANLVKYGSMQPPLYNLGNILVPTYLVYGQNDYLATENNVIRLYNELSAEAQTHGMYKIPYEKFSHDDFLTAKDVKTLLYDNLIQFMSTL